eukprot:TRINITY_DN1838_c0_g2_i1.p1 TRINITY_DN1838_c0_g2~~TRINITY_DN1838_c0_g2_i1.p1  ORF type:complete len:574 (-),score=138.39 TRINITY_DN1838_c0_g2_i1:231-1952(-)
MCIRDSINAEYGRKTAKLMATFGDDQLYYGSIPVHLTPVPGKTVPYQHADWEPLTGEEAVSLVVSRADPVGPESDIVVPAIPALDYALKAGAEAEGALEDWPEYMRTPLLKVPEPVEGEPLAFASGVRSNTFKLGDKWYRLKGSGNNDEGFIIKEETFKRDGGDQYTRTIRGSAWMHTAIRENAMTARLAAAMEPLGILGGNISMGAYEYGPPNQPFGPEDSVPACIVEGTRGDRRLGTHVFAGLEILMDRLLDTEAVGVEELAKKFPEVRRHENPREGECPVVSTAAFMSDHMLGVEYAACGVMEPGTNGLSWNVPRDKSTILDGTTLELPLRWVDPQDFPKQWTNQGSRDMSPEWKQLWSTTVEEYNALAGLPEGEGGTGSALVYLYNRIGNDCGRIIRAMHDDRVSWGTYQDTLCFDGQWHCNAHANNVMILDEQSAPPDMFLGYLDLDMAFDDQSFVSVYGKNAPKGTVGIPAAEHDVLLRREHVNFMEVLAGGDTTSGVPQVAKEQVGKQPVACELTKAVLYDALVLGYLNAYERDETMALAPVDEKQHRLARLLIKMAIMVMADFVA